MPYADKEKNKESKKQYYESVKDTDEYKQKTRENTKKWRIKNKEKYERSDRISKWRKRGLVETWYYTYGELYDYYMKTANCENCNITLTIDKTRKSTTKCMHHIHKTGEFEMIVCHACNVRLK